MYYSGAAYGAMHYGGFPRLLITYNVMLEVSAMTNTTPVWGYTDDWSLAGGDPETDGICVDSLQYTDIDIKEGRMGYHRDSGTTLEFDSEITLVQEFNSKLPWQ